MAQPMIRFFRVATRPQSGIPGALYFVVNEGIMYVCTSETAFEAYAGIKNASLEGGVLTLTPSVGEALTIDIAALAQGAVDLSAYAKSADVTDAINQEATRADIKAAELATSAQTAAEAKAAELATAAQNAAIEYADKLNHADTTYEFGTGEGLGQFTVKASDADAASTITVAGLGTAAGKNEEYFVKAEGFNAYSEADEAKLAGIAAGAEVNIIEEVQVNGVALEVSTDGKRAVNVVIPAATVTGVKAGDEVLALEGTELKTQLSLAYEAIEDKKYIVLRGLNGVEIDKIDASDFIAQSFLNDVSLDESDNLQFVWNMADGSTKTDTVNIAKYIDTYTAGNGIDVTDKAISVKLAEGSESFLTVDAAGLKLAGVQDAIDAAVAAKHISANGDAYVSATVAEGTNTVTVAASEATKASLALADSALQSADITTGAANGTIAVEGVDVAVKGLGGAAYVDTTATPTENSTAAFTAGGAYVLDGKIAANTAAIEEIKGEVSENAQVTAAALVDLDNRLNDAAVDVEDLNEWKNSISEGVVLGVNGEAGDALNNSDYVKVKTATEEGIVSVSSSVKIAAEISADALPLRYTSTEATGLATDKYVRDYVATQLAWGAF